MRRSGFILCAIASSFAAAVVYAWALFEAPFIDPRSAGEYCAGRPPASPPIEEHWFPPAFRCNWDDGTSTDLVPGFVTPLLVLLAAAAVAAVVAAVRTPPHPTEHTAEMGDRPREDG
ncbi:hypothetical protein [Actinomadura violacea]|uniref:Uncharacterized protein n=1 Tax=Actinomadura violacea TaxID=2819934 RepID=A0ABS3S563_9ACTN|nr:hypothetical protein [Actinomadura violacea]MBO2464142.1 hypothetical protein [Actinomadura violacea]